MHNKNQLRKIVQKLIIESFDNNSLSESKVKRIIKMFQGLAKSEAIYALSLYLKGLRQQIEQQTLLIESSVPLTQSELKKVESRFKKEFKINKVENKINSSLLGGLKVKIGDMVYDNSLKQKIEQIGKVLHG